MEATAVRVLRYAALIVLVIAAGIVISLVLRHFHSVGGIQIIDLLAVLAIVFATIQFMDSREHKRGMIEHQREMAEHTHQMQEQTREMNTIAQSMSTRFVGLFPKNIGEITSVIQRANQRIRIMADYVDYGHYSSPKQFHAYKESLLAALDKQVDVRIICYDKTVADRELKSQFPDDAFLADEEARRKFGAYFSFHKGLEQPRNAADLRSLLSKRQEWYIRELGEKRAQFRYFSARVEFFLWLEDNEEAVFVFKDSGPGQGEFSFRTHDIGLIEQFSKIFEERWKESIQNYEELKPAAGPASTWPFIEQE